MKVLFIALIFFFMPAVCLAHSGILARVALNYVPLLFALIPSLSPIILKITKAIIAKIQLKK